MPRRRRPGRTAASRRSAPPEPEGRLRAPLAALFPDGLPKPPPPPAPPSPPPPQLVSERELMARAFAALATGDSLDFDAMQVVTRLTSATGPKRHVTSASSPATPKTSPRAPVRAIGPADDAPPVAFESDDAFPALLRALVGDVDPRHATGRAPAPMRDAGPRAALRHAPETTRDAAPRSATGHAPETTRDTAPRSATGHAPEPTRDAGPRSALGHAPEPAIPAVALRGRTWAGAGWRDEPGRTLEHARAAAELVARARRGRLPTLRLRGLRREPAVEALTAFVTRERAAGTRYVRIVTGKGLGSPGDPVLKEALAEWCASVAGEAEVAAWAPELDVRGEYGSVILQLRPRA